MMLHIIEPTLNSYAGHCLSLVEALAAAMPTLPLQIWAGRGSERFWTGPGQVQPYFLRPLRRLQVFLLYRQLLKGPDKLLVSTAGTTDFVAIDAMASGLIPASKVYLYVHWLGAKADKVQTLSRIAQRQPHLEVLATTPSAAAFFKGLGFRSRHVPYPVQPVVTQTEAVPPFSHLLVAGAARMDKGFDKIVALVEAMAREQSELPIVVQASSTHRDKHPPVVQQLIERLRACRYPHLKLLTDTLQPEAYRSLFSGGISVQPYLATDFEDRVSGVALDALRGGCPLVVTADTWLARKMQEGRAGVACADLSPQGLLAAVNTVLADYAGYAERARVAGQALQSQHSAGLMVDAIFGPPA